MTQQQPLAEIRPGTYLTSDGSTAVVSSLGCDGLAHGLIRGGMTSTWWHPDGRHNLYRDYDLDLSSPATLRRRPCVQATDGPYHIQVFRAGWTGMAIWRWLDSEYQLDWAVSTQQWLGYAMNLPARVVAATR